MEKKAPSEIQVKLGRNHRFARLWKKTYGKHLWNSALITLRNKISEIGEDDVEEGLLIAMERYPEHQMIAFKYFCGVCRQKINRMGDGGELVCIVPEDGLPFLARAIGEQIYPINPPTADRLRYGKYTLFHMEQLPILPEYFDQIMEKKKATPYQN